MKNDIITVDSCKKEFIKLIERLSPTHDKWQAFTDFVEMSAIAISNNSDPVHYEEREKRYLEIAGGYTRDELELFVQMLTTVMTACNLCMEQPRDILGELYHAFELHNKWKGQFFSPQHICDFMGEIQMIDLDERMPDKGYVTVSDPCVGGGAMILGFAGAMANHKRDYHTEMLATATDIDLKCVCMAYIQFSLYGIPAVVIHGDSLTLKEWSHWFTPEYVMMNSTITEVQ